MALEPYSPDDDSFPDLAGNGGYGSANAPGSGPLEMIQDGDPFDWEPHYQGQGSTTTKHGLFGWILIGLAFIWARFNLVMSLGRTFLYHGAQFDVGNARVPILAATNASPIVCTFDPSVSTTAAMRNNMEVTIADGTGMTSINGTWRVQVIDNTHFLLVGSTGNGTYNASSADASWPQSTWTFAQWLADNVAVATNALVTFTGNVVVNGTLSAPTFTPGVVQPTKYYGGAFFDTPGYTGGGGGQTKTIGDAVGSGVDYAIANVIRFSNWGGSGENDGMTITLAAHTGSDNPMLTIVFDPNAAINAASLLILDAASSITVFEVGSAVPTYHNCGSGSVTFVWKSGSGYRLVGFSGFLVAPGTTAW